MYVGHSVGVAVNPHLPGSEDPKHDFHLLLKHSGCSASSVIRFVKSCLQQQCSTGRESWSPLQGLCISVCLFVYFGLDEECFGFFCFGFFS